MTTVLYYFCNNYRSSETNSLAAVFRAYCCQLVQRHEGLCLYLFEEYISKGLNASSPTLLQALQSMLNVGNARIIIDGADEWDLGTVKKLLTDLTRLTTGNPSTKVSHKLLISSRDVPQISRILSRKPIISLTDETLAVGAAIRAYAHSRIADLRHQLSDTVLSDADEASILQELENRLVEKSNGE